MGLLTNGTQEQQLEKVQRTGLVNVFDAVCTSERIGVQ
jgi:putative hydrolase of the HAD superfamily